MSVQINLKKSKSNTIEFGVEFEQTKLELVISNEGVPPIARNQRIIQASTIYNNQIKLEYIKTPGCSCSDNKKIVYKGKENKCDCITPAMFKVYITKLFLPGVVINACFLIAVTDKVSIHWQKEISYSENCLTDISKIALGSFNEGYVLDEPFYELGDITLVANDSDIDINPYNLILSISNLDKTIDIPTKFIEQKTFINKTSKLIELKPDEKYNPFKVHEGPDNDAHNKHIRKMEYTLENMTNDLKSKIAKFVGEDDKKEGDVDNGK